MGIGVHKRLFFHLPKTNHVTMPGARGGMDAEVVDIRETEGEFQADMPLLEPLDMNMVTRGKTILFRTAKDLAKGNRRRLPRVRLAFVPIGGTAGTGRNYEISKEMYTGQRRNWSLFWYTHNGHSTHTMQRTLFTRHHDPPT